VPPGGRVVERTSSLKKNEEDLERVSSAAALSVVDRDT